MHEISHSNSNNNNKTYSKKFCIPQSGQLKYIFRLWPHYELKQEVLLYMKMHGKDKQILTTE